MKKLLLTAGAILSLASCHKEKTYCICYLNNVEVDRKETNLAEDCEKLQINNRKALNDSEVYCVIQKD